MINVNEKLENDLAEVIKEYIKSQNLHPQEAAVTVVKMAQDFLDGLSWKTQSVQCADIYLKEAQNWLAHGMGTPVLNGTDGGDRDVLESLITESGGCWIPLSEGYPPIGESVLVSYLYPDVEPEIDFMEVCADTGAEYFANNTEVTHWLPIPKRKE